MSRSVTLNSARGLAWHALLRVELDGAYSDKVLTQILNDHLLNVQDKAFLSELVRGTIRWKKRLDWILTQLLRSPDTQLPHEIRFLLWLGLYQLLFTQVPSFAAVSESVTLAKQVANGRFGNLVNGVLRNYIRNADRIQYPNPKKYPVQAMAVRYSHPEWMVKRWLERFGSKETEQLCQANNRAPVLYGRLNPKVSQRDLETRLTSHHAIFESTALPGFYRLIDVSHELQMALLQDGWLTIQDLSAGLPGLMINPRPGEIIFDVCSAPGGKSTHLAELSWDSARIVASDLNRSRLRLVKEAAVRLNLHAIAPIAATARHFPAGQADVVLIDAPCSGLGVLRKKPDLRWRRTLKEMKELPILQNTILESMAPHVKPGGRLAYCTCTIEPGENEVISAEFLRRHAEFELDSTSLQNIPETFRTTSGFARTMPHLHDMDGSFAAIYKKRITAL